MISVLILTLDEEVNIAACLDALPWRDDVWVLDSGSRDETVALARAKGANVVVREFTDYADQRNAGFALPFAHDWLVMLDADERMTPELAAQIEALVRAPGDATMACARRRDIFLGRWLKRSSGYPTWFARVFRRGTSRVERAINERYVTTGETAYLTEHLVHFPFNKGVDWWFERHNRYSSMEAIRLTRESRDEPVEWSSLVSADPARRRQAAKRLAYLLPGRPFLVFLYLYVLRFGFLDGRAGLAYASMRMAYEIMIDAKMAANRSAPLIRG